MTRLVLTRPGDKTVAVLYQAVPAPSIGGIRKPMKPGGYADSGADIAYVLRENGFTVATPEKNPRADRELDWVFPDHAEGIRAARAAGAGVLWANTILFNGHPIERAARELWIVGQPPALVEKFDDKWVTNSRLRESGCPVATSMLVGRRRGGAMPGLHELSEGQLADRGLRFPLVVKPVRGRGSQGVARVDGLDDLLRVGFHLLGAKTTFNGTAFPAYGKRIIVEEYLVGKEITVTVMPPGTYVPEECGSVRARYWAFPPVARFNHREGIAPYAGLVSVIENSRVLSPDERSTPALREVLAACVRAAEIIGPLAPIRIDCRQTEEGEFRLFDVNMKPNMTGSGRPGREDQDSLTCLGARAIGWSYGDLLRNMLRQAWTERGVEQG